LRIRKTTENDLERIMEIYAYARQQIVIREYDHKEQPAQKRCPEIGDQLLKLRILQHSPGDEFSVDVAYQSQCYHQYGARGYRYRLQPLGKEVEPVFSVADRVCSES
jgi:hypothetical protein